MYNFTNFLITLKNVRSEAAVVLPFDVVIHSFRYIILYIEINIATTSDLVPFGSKLPSNSHWNLLFSVPIPLPLFVTRVCYLLFACSYSPDIFIYAFIGWIIAFDWLDFIAISIKPDWYHFINCMLLYRLWVIFFHFRFFLQRGMHSINRILSS